MILVCHNNPTLSWVTVALFWAIVCKTVALCYRTVVLSGLSCLSVSLVYCGQTLGWIKMKLGTEVGLGPGDIVLDGDPAPPHKKGHSPHFSAHVYCRQTVAHLSNSWALVFTYVFTFGVSACHSPFRTTDWWRLKTASDPTRNCRDCR